MLVCIVLSVLLRYTDSDYPFGILWPLCCLFFDIRILITPLVSYGHCNVCPSSIYDSDYPFGIFNKGNNKITELRTILQRESQNS